MAQVVSLKEPHIELPLLTFFSLLFLWTAYQCRLLFLRKTAGLPRQSTILLLPGTHDRTAIALPTSVVGMLSNFWIICRSPTCAASCSGLHVRSCGQGQRDRVSQCNVRRFRCRRSSGTVPSFVGCLFSRHASPRTDFGTFAFAPRARGATSSVLVWEVCGWARRFPRGTFASYTSFVSSPFRWHASSFSHASDIDVRRVRLASFRVRWFLRAWRRFPFVFVVDVQRLGLVSSTPSFRFVFVFGVSFHRFQWPCRRFHAGRVHRVAPTTSEPFVPPTSTHPSPWGVSSPSRMEGGPRREGKTRAWMGGRRWTNRRAKCEEGGWNGWVDERALLHCGMTTRASVS